MVEISRDLSNKNHMSGGKLCKGSRRWFHHTPETINWKLLRKAILDNTKEIDAL